MIGDYKWSFYLCLYVELLLDIVADFHCHSSDSSSVALDDYFGQKEIAI